MPDDAERLHPNAAPLSKLLDGHRAQLLRHVERSAQGLLRHESGEDVVQGIHLRALRQAGQFEYRSDREFWAWLMLVARQYVGDRHDYWTALRRQGGRMLRVTASAASESGGGVDPAALLAGASTFASRREMMEIAARAIALMLPRDQELVKSVARGDSIEEMAAALGIQYDAAEQAKRRALDRFRKTFELVSRQRASK